MATQSSLGSGGPRSPKGLACGHPAFDSDTAEFLGTLKPGTYRSYRVALQWFQRFYAPQGSIKDFLDRVDEDQAKPRRQKKRVALNVLREFSSSLQQQGLAPKTTRGYISAVQSLAQYFEVTISLKHLNLPAPLAQSKKYPWNLDSVGRFIAMFDASIYRALAAVFFQSGLGIGDALALSYGDIKQEYEAGTCPLCLDLARIKTSNPFMTFIGAWGLGILKEYLQGQHLEPDSQLFPISKRAVEDYFAHIAGRFVGEYKYRNPVGPHTLRAGFRTLLGDQKVEPLYIEFWMGHSRRGREQEKVYVSKSRDGWRATYHELAEPCLTPRS